MINALDPAEVRATLARLLEHGGPVLELAYLVGLMRGRVMLGGDLAADLDVLDKAHQDVVMANPHGIDTDCMRVACSWCQQAATAAEGEWRAVLDTQAIRIGDIDPATLTTFERALYTRIKDGGPDHG